MSSILKGWKLVRQKFQNKAIAPEEAAEETAGSPVLAAPDQVPPVSAADEEDDEGAAARFDEDALQPGQKCQFLLLPTSPNSTRRKFKVSSSTKETPPLLRQPN